jgi:hypothetical protein
MLFNFFFIFKTKKKDEFWVLLIRSDNLYSCVKFRLYRDLNIKLNK